jgi:hypothetical protein
MTKLATHLKISIGCLLFGFVASSFWGGYSCTTTAKSFGDRIQLGLTWILLSFAKLGRLTTDPLRTKVYNVWPLALLIGFGSATLVYLLLAYKKKSNTVPSA